MMGSRVVSCKTARNVDRLRPKKTCHKQTVAIQVSFFQTGVEFAVLEYPCSRHPCQSDFPFSLESDVSLSRVEIAVHVLPALDGAETACKEAHRTAYERTCRATGWSRHKHSGFGAFLLRAISWFSSFFFFEKKKKGEGSPRLSLDGSGGIEPASSLFPFAGLREPISRTKRGGFLPSVFFLIY